MVFTAVANLDSRLTRRGVEFEKEERGAAIFRVGVYGVGGHGGKILVAGHP